MKWSTRRPSIDLMHFDRWRIVVGAAIWLLFNPTLARAVDRADQNAKECNSSRLIIGPPSVRQLDDLLSHPSVWRDKLPLVAGIIHADHDLDKQDVQVRSKWFKALEALSLCLELEVGVIKEWSKNSKETYQIESAMWARFERDGASIASLAMDEPLLAARLLRDAPKEAALAQTVEFVRLARSFRPSLLIGDVEPFPAIDASEHVWWAQRLDHDLKLATGRGLDFYRIDPDWNAFDQTHGWKELQAVLDDVRALDVKASMIVWAAKAPAERRAGRLSLMTWSDELDTQLGAFALAGGSVDQIVVESWIDLPPDALPVEVDATFAGSVRRLVASYPKIFE